MDGAAEVIVTVPRAWKVQPGQYVRFWTPASGYWAFLQTHPFTVAWWTEDENGKAVTVSLLVKGQHGLSRSLVAMKPREPFVASIGGPFGNTVDTTHYNTIVLFATGIGIAAQLPVLKQAFSDYQQGKNIVRRLSIIWQMDSERTSSQNPPLADAKVIDPSQMNKNG